jgi:aminopeptidase YwaD
LTHVIDHTISTHPGIVKGEARYQGDHGLFLMNQVPALAFTSTLVSELMAEITHTPKDLPELVDSSKMVELALALRDLLIEMNSTNQNI